MSNESSNEGIIAIGASLVFDPSSLESLKAISDKVDQINKVFEKTSAPIIQFQDNVGKASGEIQQLQSAVGTLQKSIKTTFEDSKGNATGFKFKEQIEDAQRYGKVIETIYNAQGELQRSVTSEINNVAQRTKDVIKAEEQLTKQLTYEYNVRRQIAATQQKMQESDNRRIANLQRNINNTANGSVAGNTYMAQLMGMGWTGGAEVSNIFSAKNGEMISINTNNLKQYFDTLGKGVAVTKDIGSATEGWVRTQVSLREGSNTARNIEMMWNQELQKGIVIGNKSTEGILDRKKALTSWGEAIQTAWERSIQWLISMTALYGTIRLIQQGFQDLLRMETETVNIEKVLNGTNAQKNAQGGVLTEGAIQIAKRYGQSVIDVQVAMQSWSRMFKNTNDIIKMTNASLLLATATDISFEGSVKHLSSIMAEWNMNTNQVVHASDVLNSMSNKYRITAESLAEGLTKAGAAAKTSGMQFEELAGIITTGVQTLGLSGSEVATMWNRTMARMAANKGAKEAFQNLGIDPNQSVSKLMNELMTKWDGMTAAEKRNFSITVAGTVQWAKFAGIMNSYNTVLQATVDSYFSFNSAQSEVNLMMSTTQKKIAQLSASWQEFMHQNSALLGATQGLVSWLGVMLNGLKAMPPAILYIIAALAVIIPLIAKFRFEWIATKAAIMATQEAASSVQIAFTMMKNPIVALITILGVLAVVFTTVGILSNKTASQLEQVKNAINENQASLDKYDNYLRGVEDLSSKYESLYKAVEKAKKSGKDYAGLQEKLLIVTNGLKQAMAEFGIKTNDIGNSYEKLKNKIMELKTAIYNERQLELMKSMDSLVMQKVEIQGDIIKTKAMIEMSQKRMEQWSKENILQKLFTDRLSKEKIEMDKKILQNKSLTWWEKYEALIGNAINPNSSYISDIFSSKLTDLNKTLNEIEMARKELELQFKQNQANYLQTVLQYSNTDDYGSDGGTKKTTNIQMSKFNEEQAKWIRTIALQADVKGGTPGDKLQTIIYDYIDEATGKIKGHLDSFMASSESISQAEQMITNWITAINEFVSASKSAIDATNSLITSFDKLKKTPVQEFSLELDRSINNLVKPKNDIEKQFEDMFTNFQNIYIDAFNKANSEVENRQALIQKAQEQIGNNNKTIDMAEAIKRQMDLAIPIDEKTKQQVLDIMRGLGLNVKDFTSDAIDQMIGILRTSNDELGMKIKLASNSTGELMKWTQDLQDVQKQFPDMQNIITGMLGTLDPVYEAFRKAQDTLSNTPADEGSYSKYLLQLDAYNSKADWITALNSMLENAKANLADAQKNGTQYVKFWETWVGLLNNMVTDVNKEMSKAPKDPFQLIEEKYKKVQDDMQSTMRKYGYSPFDFGINPKNEVGELQNKMLDNLKLLTEAETKLNGDAKLTNEAIAKWNEVRDTAIANIEAIKKQIESTRLEQGVGDAFKAILKGTKTLKQAFLDMFAEIKDRNIDDFINKLMDKWSDFNSYNPEDKSIVNQSKNLLASFQDVWKNASNSQRASMISGAASMFIQNNGSRQSYQDQGILNGATTGFQVGGIWGAIIGGVAGLFGGTSQYKKEQAKQRKELKQSINDSMTSDVYQAYQDFLKAGQSGFGWTSSHHTLAGITSIFGTDKEKLHKVSVEEVIKKWQELFENGKISDLINSTNNYLLQTYEKWTKYLDALSASVSNITSNLENAFQADNYYDFLQSWSQSLEEMTRTALIRGFMAQESFQKLYQNLANTIGMAVVDGTLSAEEITSIKAQGNSIGTQMQALYQSLDLLNSMWGQNTNNNSSSSQTYTAGSSTPIIYNNYVTVEAGIFWGDKDQARQCALWIRDEIVAEEGRA